MAQFDNAQEAMGFVTDQTKAVNATVYAAEYPEHDYASLIPVDSSAPEWASGMITYLTDTVGRAEFISGQGNDIPLADVIRGKSDQNYELAGLGYEFNLEEINRAYMLGMPLTTLKADAAREGSQQLLYSLAFSGNASKGMVGLLNSTAVVTGNVALNAGATSRLWANKTPQEILADIDAILIGGYLATKTVELADTLIMSPERLGYLNTVTMGANSDRTLLSFIRENNFFKLTTGRDLTIRACRLCSTAGATGTQRMVAYRRDPRTLTFHLPMPHKFLPVWQNSPMGFLVPGIFRTGGTEIRRPSAVRYADGF